VSATSSTVLGVPHVDLPRLTESERDALVAAAAWYAKYHAEDIAEDARDTSMAAVTERERYVALLEALAKFGVTMALPDELTGWGRSLAA